MKIWWPWRKRKQPLTLFEPYPKNAPGPFYVMNEECITCGAPHAVAPDLMAWEDSEGAHSHCYFKKQPEDPYELTQAIAAVAQSCCGALCYAGSDPEIIKRLRKAGAGHAVVKRR